MVTRLIPIVLLCTMAGCQTAPKGQFCAIARPVHPSQATIEAMTDREVADMVAYLEKGVRMCGWKP